MKVPQSLLLVASLITVASCSQKSPPDRPPATPPPNAATNAPLQEPKQPPLKTASSQSSVDLAIHGTWLLGPDEIPPFLLPLGPQFESRVKTITISANQISMRFTKPLALLALTDSKGNSLPTVTVVKDGDDEYFVCEGTYAANTNTTPHVIDLRIPPLKFGPCAYKLENGDLWFSRDAVGSEERPSGSHPKANVWHRFSRAKPTKSN